MEANRIGSLTLLSQSLEGLVKRDSGREEGGEGEGKGWGWGLHIQEEEEEEEEEEVQLVYA